VLRREGMGVAIIRVTEEGIATVEAFGGISEGEWANILLQCAMTLVGQDDVSEDVSNILNNIGGKNAE